MEQEEYQKAKRFYFIGIGGVSMSALANYLVKTEKTVYGYDLKPNGFCKCLEEAGIRIGYGKSITDFDKTVIRNSDVIVKTDAINEKDQRLVFALHENKTVVGRADLLKCISNEFENVISVAGSHGKTTCTSMLAHIVKCANVPFCAHIGGEDSEFSNFYYDGKKVLVTEACEYKKNVLKMFATHAVLLNIDCDHMECYDGKSDLIATFSTYIRQAKYGYINLDDENCGSFSDCMTFSLLNGNADFFADSLRQTDEEYSFSVLYRGVKLCRIRLNTYGKVNVYNALAAFAVAYSFGFPVSVIKRGLESFVGVKRRFEKVGCFHGIPVVCDYAHHPRELEKTYETAKKCAKGKVLVIFQPHTFSRTENLFDEFVAFFKKCDDSVIYRTFPARERYGEKGSAKRLQEKIGRGSYAFSVGVLKDLLSRKARGNKMILVLGAGDIYEVIRKILSI